ncbi:radical SAM protein [Candidatus Woesearchaeota archaeon]|nr:radical SAM protein [Candidatus Woesearchaeota archaeon]
MVKGITLIQPRHNLAPKMGMGHIYMPTPLLCVASRLIGAGVDVLLNDENFEQYFRPTNLVGIHLGGVSYIPLAREIINERYLGHKYFIGGPVVNGLSEGQFRKLFGNNAFNGNLDSVLERELNIFRGDLKRPEETSLIEGYELICDEVMFEYLARESSLYVSQGCKFACNFCAADRTCKDPVTGKMKIVRERYRDLDVLREDLVYLANRAKRLGLSELSFYMSNLDVFQTPGKLLEFVNVVEEVRSKENVEFKLRGLSTVDSFLRTDDDIIGQLVDVGFYSVGFGVDGMTAEVWNKVKKGHNTEDKCLNAIKRAYESRITPELLMVFGHNGADTEGSLRKAYDFSKDMVEVFGAIPRPHVAKAFLPGNDGWTDLKYQSSVRTLLDHPELFHNLDFTTLPTELTHPNRELRLLTIKYFLEICNLPGNTTKYLLPIEEGMTSEQQKNVVDFNRGRYDH